MSGTDIKSEAILERLKNKLNKSCIRLWQPPYVPKDGSNGNSAEKALLDLAEQLGADLQIDIAECVEGLKKLQDKALDNLRNRDLYRETGFAAIKVKLSGLNRTITIRIDLNETTEKLQDEISAETNIPSERWKLICAGKVLEPRKQIGIQGVQNGTSVLGVMLTENKNETDKIYKEITKIKGDIKLLSHHENFSGKYFKVEDQKGRDVEIPKEEKDALLTAIILHDKGKAAIKEGDYALALLMLLEADKEFSSCSSDLLKLADNYAVLNLDIAWVYLCLRTFVHLPDAEERLQLCELNFKKCYGDNLERLIAIKGTSGNEAVLFMRLHLLQGIVKFYKNKKDEAHTILTKAQKELLSLKIDHSSLSALMELGLTESEARIGLRACYGSRELATNYILNKRREREMSEAADNEKRLKRRRQKKFGTCADGNDVDMEIVDYIMNVGGHKEYEVVNALKISNNNKDYAIQVLNDLGSGISPSEFYHNVEMLVDGGYPSWMVRLMLKKCNNNIDLAITELNLTGGTHLVNPGNDETDESDENNESDESDSSEEDEFHIEIQQAISRISEGICKGADDYLDLSLIEEEIFLNEYLSMLT